MSLTRSARLQVMAALAALVLALAGCAGGAQTGPSGNVSSPAVASAAPPSLSASGGPSSRGATPAPSAGLVPAQVYFTAGGRLAAEAGQVSADNPARSVLELLLQGPKDAAHFTEIPKGTRLLDLTIKDGTALASFDSAFFAPGGATGTELRLAQVVFTLTQFPTISEVQLLQDGHPPPVMGEGLNVSRPLSRGTFPRLP